LTGLIFLLFFTETMDTTMMLIQWVLYIMTMCNFHLAEFFVTALYNPTALSTDSFLVNHSLAYTTAFAISFCEFWVRFFFFRKFNCISLAVLGGMLMIIGLSIRFIAMKTCGQCFNHIIQYSNKDNHHLVKRGIYQYFRHPSYVGYFYWAVGTQIHLCNPISFILYLNAAWTFFSIRIPYEESTLLYQYGEEYREYMKNTWVGIPLIPSKIPESTNPPNKMD